MRAISNFLHLMPATVQIAPRTGIDGDGNPTYGADVAYRCHIRGETKLVRTRDGRDTLSSRAVYLASNALIQPDARITLSAADVGASGTEETQPLIVAVEHRHDENGPHHTVLRLGDGRTWTH